ncbi:MAG TPA: hypothetical protein VGG74_01775 [Kofleriaceae bacterium]
MKILAKNLGFATFLALGSLAAGCATSPSTPPGDEGGDGGSDSGGGGGGEGGSGGDGGGGMTGVTLDASGTYALTSTYDVASNIPGTVGTIINDFIAATDDPNDPTQWLLQLLVNQLPSGTIQTIANDALPFVSGYLNDQLLNWAPSFVGDIKTVGQDFGDIAKKFGVNETYVVTKGSNGSYTAVDTATGVHFTIGTVQEDFNFTDYNSTNVVVNGVPLAMDNTGKITIGEHSLGLPYGKILNIGLDAAILPLVDPNATDLASFFADEIDCNSVGTYIEQAIENDVGIDLGSSVFVTACTEGLKAGANLIYSQLNNLSTTALTFDLASGIGKGVDTNGDGSIDQINTGAWSGTLDYSGAASAPLATATFTGKRM